jgi:hypothetical protein
LSRRLRAGKSTIPLIGPVDAIPEAESKQLMLQQALESHGDLSAVRRPAIEVVPTSSLVTEYYRGVVRAGTNGSPLEIFKNDGEKHHSAAFEELYRLEKQLDATIVRPLASILESVSGTCINDPSAIESNRQASPGEQDDDVAVSDRNITEDVRWAHFMLRSRAIAIHDTSSAPVIVPVVDMINHSVDSNVNYHQRRSDGAVVVASTRRIPQGHELLINYRANSRLRLFADSLFATSSRGQHRSPSRSPAQSAKEAAAAAIARTETEQRYEIIQDEQTQMKMLQSEHNSEEAETLQSMELGDGAWQWLFGFTPSPEEKEYLASGEWSRHIRDRIAKLTDVRRRGRPGEFVVGVPEGLRYLHQARERLERERFGGQRVFPPHAT